MAADRGHLADRPAVFPTVGEQRQHTHSYIYSDFIAQVNGNQIKTATINPSGKVTGDLVSGDGSGTHN
jgi:hypothetical protein